MTPNREQLEQDLLAYVEGTLPPDEHARMEIYVANTDPKLAKQIAGMLDDRLALQSLPAISAPADLAGRIMDRVERQSLIGGVEKQLVHEPRRWFLNRLAIAAGLIIVVGGFSFYMINMAYHGDTPLHDLVLTNAAPDSAAGRAKSLAAARPAIAEQSHEDQSDALLANAGGPNPVATASPAGAVASTRAIDHDAEVKALVERGRLSALGNAVASHDYKSVASTREAMALMEAAIPRQSTDSPVVITVVARDGQDVQRLETLLASYSAPVFDDAHRTATESLKKDLAQGAAGPAVPAPPARADLKGMRAIVGTAPDTYHLLLKPEQLDQLSHAFAIVSVARGDAAYSIAGTVVALQEDQGRGKLSANAGELRQSAGQAPQQFAQNQINGNDPSQYNMTSNGNATNGTNTVLGAGPLAMGGQGGKYAVNGNNAGGQLAGGNRGTYNTNDENAPTAQPAATSPVEKAAAEHNAVTDTQESANGSAAPWIDCVITIVPPPANSTVQPGSLQQK